MKMTKSQWDGLNDIVGGLVNAVGGMDRQWGMTVRDHLGALQERVSAHEQHTQRINRRRDETLGLAKDLREADDRLTETQDAHDSRIRGLEDRMRKAEAAARTNYTVVQSHSDRLAALDDRLGDLENRRVPDGRERLARLELLLDVKKDEFGAWGAGAVGDLHERINRLAALEQGFGVDEAGGDSWTGCAAIDGYEFRIGKATGRTWADLSIPVPISGEFLGFPIFEYAGLEPDNIDSTVVFGDSEADGDRIRQLQADLDAYKQLNEDIAGERDLIVRKLRRLIGDVAEQKAQVNRIAKERDGLREENGILTAERDDAQEKAMRLEADLNKERMGVHGGAQRIAEMEAALLAVSNAEHLGTAHRLARAALGLVSE